LERADHVGKKKLAHAKLAQLKRVFFGFWHGHCCEKLYGPPIHDRTFGPQARSWTGSTPTLMRGRRPTQTTRWWP
jgi:hypothetical protein